MERIGVASLLSLLMMAGCAQTPLNQADQYAQDTAARREWLRGPMMGTCSSLPGAESRGSCVMVLQRTLTQLRGESLAHEDHLRIEFAKAKGTDETAHLWTRDQREAWLRGPRTQACRRAPFSVDAHWCLDGVERDLDALTTPDDVPVDPPDVRARRAVARLEMREQKRAIERQRAHELELAQEQAAEQALLGLGMGDGSFQNTIAPGLPQYQPQPQPAPVLPLNAPRPPATCTSQHVGEMTYTDCY